MDKKITIISLILAVAIGLSIFLYGYGEEPIPLADDTGVTSEGVNSVVNANNQFAFDLYKKYQNDSKDDNIFFSPFSISTALAVTYEGAKGQTAEEMQKVFHFPADNNIRRPAFAKIYNDINKKDKKYLLFTANALWAQKDYPFLNEYFNTTEKYYGGKVTNLDFVKETEKSRVIINDWVEKQTDGKIKELLPKSPPMINSLTSLVLTNAICFKGDWLLKFDKNKTEEADFKVSPDKTVKTQMMALTGENAKFNYTETEELQILEIPYSGNELSMIILLPKKNNLKSIEHYLTLKNLNQWKNKLQERKINVYIPKFRFETKYFMKEDLKAMGMPTAFSGQADFSGMDGKKDLFISNIIHQAFIEVNEEGTEASAATGVIMMRSGTISTAMSEFRADHPFIFIIQQKENGNILFLGKVTDPTK